MFNEIKMDLKDEINLDEINWNNLSPEEFMVIEQRLQQNKKNLKKQKSERSSGFSLVKIQGKIYSIKTTIYKRLITLKSDKSKQKLITEIVSNNNPVNDL